MSGKVMKWAWPVVLPTQSEKTMYMALAYHADKTGLAWPKLGQLMEKSNLTKGGARYVLRKMKQGGFISIEPRYGTTGRQTSNAYQLLKGGYSKYDPSPVQLSLEGEGIVVTVPHDIQLEIQEGNTNCGEPQTGDFSMKVSQVVDKHDKPTRDKIFSKALRKKGKLSPDGCAYLWRNCRQSAADDNGFQAELMVKDKKALANAYGRVGEEFPDAVWNAMENWVGFTTYAEKQAGAFNCPLQPTIAFFVKFVEVAVSYTPNPTSGFVQLSAKPSKPLTKPKETVDNTNNAITSEELAAIGKELFE